MAVIVGRNATIPNYRRKNVVRIPGQCSIVLVAKPFSQAIFQSKPKYNAGTTSLKDKKISWISGEEKLYSDEIFARPKELESSAQEKFTSYDNYIKIPARKGVEGLGSEWKYWNRPKIENWNGASEKTFTHTHLLRITSRTSVWEPIQSEIQIESYLPISILEKKGKPTLLKVVLSSAVVYRVKDFQICNA
ncbi:unnamed protein product [Nesidiocoris tenuis]|uniref:Uncharacterized protein n=1 Tax=Nesidiocoris tenuis TaxID=355587 RepID=A0A6H5G777_9HEMI|nr:unnamed protein product [Nesidiocoris tenuis]